MDNVGKIEDFKEYLIDSEKSENTIDNYLRTVHLFYHQYDEVSKKNMIAFKQDQLSRWKPKTAASRCVAMNQYCKFIGKPECEVKTIKIQKQLSVENVITLEQYEYLLECLQQDKKEKYYWMVKYLAKTGARVSEFIRFERRHLEDAQVTLWTKGKIRKILIPQNLIEESNEYFSRQQDSKWMFPTKYGGPYSARGVAEVIKRFDTYGIPKEVLHPHSFRHLFAIQFLKENKDLTLLAGLMGHESLDTTSIYLRLSAEEQKRQFNEAMRW